MQINNCSVCSVAKYKRNLQLLPGTSFERTPVLSCWMMRSILLDPSFRQVDTYGLSVYFHGIIWNSETAWRGIVTREGRARYAVRTSRGRVFARGLEETPRRIPGVFRRRNGTAAWYLLCAVWPRGRAAGKILFFFFFFLINDVERRWMGWIFTSMERCRLTPHSSHNSDKSPVHTSLPIVLIYSSPKNVLCEMFALNCIT